MKRYDALVVGSGVGGAMAAHALVDAGLRVVMLERGRRVARAPSTWRPDAVMELSPYYSMDSHVRVRGDDPGRCGSFWCVGGPAVFYGGVALRMRESDFGPCPEIVGDSRARWPFGYAELEPFYGWAERLLRVAGRDAPQAHAPWRSTPFPFAAPDPRGPTRLLWRAAQSVGLRPSHLPLAIDFTGATGSPCAQCGTCDGYACAVSAKQEPASAVIPDLERRGLTLRSDTVVVRILRRGRRVVGVECVHVPSGRLEVLTADRYLLAAGALASPHLALASGLAGVNPAGAWVGGGLLRHCNGIVFGLFSRALEGGREFHKQMVLMDFYGGEGRAPRLGSIQSIHPPPPGLVRDRLPGALGRIADPVADHSTGLLVIAEDQARRENRVEASRTETDRFGLPRTVVTHRHTWRDIAARRDLACVARGVLRRAGAILTQGVRITTFSHALGTLRMGPDPRTAPVDGSGRFRGLDNLWVVDGSTLPRSGGVNPSLTIAANALRIGAGIASRPVGSVATYALHGEERP